MATIHMSEAEAACDFVGLLARVRGGTEVVIDKAASAPVVLRVAGEPTVRRLSESLSMARERHSAAVLDRGFACDLEAAVVSHPDPLLSSWD